jgi:cardiolipin synthase
MDIETKDKEQVDTQKIWTIPNALSMIRIFLIPLIIWLYCFRQEFWLTAVVVAISAVTDIVDGVIARKFCLVSNVGKLLDPVADKLTQIAIVFCLSVRFVPIRILFAVQVVKELIILILTYLAARKKKINSAQWYGKLCTVVLFAVMITHILDPFLSETVSWVLSITAIAFMLFSLAMYIRLHIRTQNDR